MSIRNRRIEFIEDFKSATQYTNSTKKKNLIRYILGRLEEENYPDQVEERPIDDSISILLKVGKGVGNAMNWGCDLSDRYIRINADYTT